VCLISGALPDWVATLATMVLMLAFKITNVSGITAQFSGGTVWLCIGVFIMSIGINNSGVMKRLALWVLTKFPGTYKAQVTAMMLSGIITTPMIPSSYAKTSIMAPLIGQVCEAVGVEPNSKAARGLWFANFMGTYILGMAFMSGSAFVGLMLGFMQGLTFTWGEWLKCTIVWYIVLIVLTYLYCTILCRPKEERSGDVSFLKEQYESLGPISQKETQGIIIIAIAIVFWVTQKLHGVDAGFIAIGANVAFFACGLITAPEVNAKGQWTLTVFIGGILSIAAFMGSTGVSAWIASLLGPIFSPIMSSPYIFVPSLCIITFVLRYAIVSQTCMLTMMIAIFGPLAQEHGISMFIIVFVEWLSGTYWNTAYSNPPVAGFVKMTGEKGLDFPTAQKASYAYMVMTIIAMTASVPLWQAIGLC
jgi:DASS family divalent anion:Na+ symporter